MNVTLGWLRVLLALMVIDEHYGFFERLFDGVVKKVGGTLHFSFVSDGDIGVTGFFIMSGFLIAEILETRYPSHSGKDFLHFVVSRYLRIFPLYLLVFSTYLLLVVEQEAGWKKIALNVLLVPYGVYDFFATDHLFNHILLTPAWTLSLDLVFYPIGYLLFKNRILLLGYFGTLVGYLCWIWVISPSEGGSVFYSEQSWWNDHVYSTAEPNLFSFLSGMLARIILNKVRIPPAIIYLALGALVYVCYLPYGISYFGGHFLGQAALVVIITALARNGSSKMESFLGSLTYSTYLIHLPVLLAVGRLVRPPGPDRLVALAVTIVLSFLVAKFIEEDIVERCRKKWLNGWKPIATNAPPEG